MKRTRKVTYRGLGLAAAGILSAAVSASAQTSSTATSATEDWIKKSKKPTDWMIWGADLRLRQEYIHNPNFIEAGKNELNYTRIRDRVWTTITPTDWLQLNARLANEMRIWAKPEQSENLFNYAGTRYSGHLDPVNGDEWILDNLNFNIAPKDWPVSLKVGRQDFMVGGKPEFGSGWILLDGTPLDGSRTYFFDAARLTYDLKECKTTINAIYLEHHANEEAWLHPIDSQWHRRYVAEQDDRGVVLYAINKSLPNTQFDGYFVYTHREREVGTGGLGSGFEGDLFAFGLRASGGIGDHWKYAAELAPEFGHHDDTGEDLTAFGFNGNLAYNFNDEMKNSLSLGLEYLSGDDPNTGTDEAWDPLWGRWPQWSELLVYYTSEFGRPSYWANLIRPSLNWTLSPVKKLEWSNTYSPLLAPENYQNQDAVAAHANFSKSGSFKGHYFQSVLRYAFNQHLRGHLWFEYFIPGDFYNSPQDKDALFLRAEVYLTY
jgi:hypothetical protein